MADRKDIIKNASQQQGQQGQQGQQDNKSQTNWKDIINNADNQQKQSNRKQIIGGDNSKVNAEKVLKDSLKDEEKYTAFSTGQIKSRGKQIGNFFDNAWHTITDEDEEHGIKDYSEYKHYKTLLDGANTDINKEAVYKQMANEGVIDYDKFTKWNEENKDNKTPFEDYNRAVEDIKESFNKSIEKTLSPYISKVQDSYKLNALTKAVERMNNQFGYFIDGYATTYKDTRDEALLTDLNSIINEYTNNVNKFVGQWAKHLVTDNDSGSGAYYNTLNDAGMRELANGIVKLERQAENKMTKAAVKSNFADSLEAIKNGNILSSAAELVGAVFNGANWILDKAGNVIEEGKQIGMGWYDVVEELANLNVYSNDAGALEKAMGTFGSWMGSILDAAPTLGPAALDIIFGSKTGIVKGVKQAGKAYRVAKTTKRAEGIDDVINAIFKSKKSYKQIAKAEDIVLGAEEGSTFGVRWMKNIMDDIMLFDLSFQQFEGHPLSDDNMAMNMLFNLPFDALAAKLAQGGRFFKAGLNEKDLITDTVSEDMLKRFQKAMKWNKGEGKSVDVMAEEWYMGRSIETSYEPKKVYTKEQIKDLPDGDKLLEYIEKVQNTSKGIWDRLTTFQGIGARDILLEVQSQLTKAQKNLSLNDQLELGMKKLVDQNKFLNLSAQQISSKQIIGYLQTLVHNNELTPDTLKRALQKGIKEDDGFKEIIYSIMTDDVELFNKARLKVEASGAELSQTELSRRLNSTVGELIQANPDLVKIKDIVGGYSREGADTWKNIFKDETIDTKTLLSRLRTMDTVDGYSKTENESMLDRIDAMISNMGKGKQDVTTVFDNTQVNDVMKNWDPNRWEGVENGVKKQYRKDNTEQVAMQSIMKKAGLNIKSVDGKFVIEGDKASLLNLKKSFELMKGTVNVNNLTGGDWVAYKLIFAKQYSNIFNSSVNAINKLNASLGKSALTQEEILTLADNWTHWTDKMYQETAAANDIEKQVKKKVLKTGIKGDNVNKAINNSLNGNGNAIDVEQEACKEVISNIMLNPKVLEDGTLDKQALKEDIKNLFKQRVKKVVPNGEGNRGYATIRESEISVIDEDTLDTIASKLVDVMETFEASSINDKQIVYSTIANWFSIIAMTPQAANTLKEQGMDFYYTILSGLIVKDENVAAKYMQKMQEYITTSIEGYKSIAEKAKGKSKQIAEEYKYNGKVGNLKAGMLQLQEGINEVKEYIANGKLKGMIPGIEGKVKDRLNFLTKNIFNSKDYDEGLKIVHSNINEKGFAKKFVNKTLDTANLTDADIDEISKYLAKRGTITSGVISKKFYENLYNGYKKGFEVAKGMGNFKIKIDGGTNRFNIKGLTSIFGILEPAFALGNIDNTNLASSIMVHELTHQQIFKEMANMPSQVFKGIQGNAVEKGVKRAEAETLSNKYFGGSMTAYIESLRNKLREAVKLSQDKKGEYSELNSFLYNYTNQYSKKEILDGIINKYSKDNLIEELVKDYQNFDRSNINNYLGSIVNNEYITAIDELITEYKTLLTLGEAGYKNINAPYINQALDILMDAANTIDRYRIICIEKNKYDNTALRAALSAEYTARDIAGNKSFEDNISNFISKEIYSLTNGDVQTNDGIRYIHDIHKAMGVDKIDVKTQTPEQIKVKLIDSLDDSIKKVKRDDVRQSYYRLKKQIEGMNGEEVMSFLDITDSVYMSPYAEYKKLLTNDTKIYEAGEEKLSGNYGTNIKNMSRLDLYRGEEDEAVKGLITLLKQNTSNQSVPVMNSILSMSSELGGTNANILSTVAKLIGMEDATIDANKLLIGEETSRLYDEYLKAISAKVDGKSINTDDIPMSFATFCTNRIVANVLSTYGLYNEGIVDVINKANRDNILTSIIDNITNSGDNWQATDRVFKAMYNSINDELGGDVFNYTAEEFIKKISPVKLGELNNKVKRYLYAQLQGGEVEALEREIKNAFLDTVSSGEEAFSKSLFKEGYAPTILKGNTGITKQGIDLAKENALRQYVNSLEKVDGRFKMNRNNALPQLMNIIQDMVGAKIITVSKDKAKLFSENVLIDLDEKTFSGFMKDYYKLLNDMEGISNNYNQTLLYQHFIYRRTDKLAKSIGELPYAKVKTDKYSKLKVYGKTQNDFNGILNEVSEESYRKYMRENPGLNIDTIYDEEGNAVVDALDNVILNDDDQVVNFAFRGENGVTTEKAETLRVIQERSEEGYNDIISEDVESIINNGSFLDKLSEPYKISYGNEYKIIETEGSNLPINVGIYYNKARNADNINAKLAANKESVGTDIYDKLVNFQKGVFDTSSPIRVANNQGIEYILHSTINGAPVRKVTVQFGNGKKVAYMLKDGELKKIGFEDTLELLDDVNSSIMNNMGVDVKFISDKGDALDVTHLGKTQLWSSFVGEDIAKEIGIYDSVVRDIDGMAKDEYRKLVGLKMNGDEGEVSVNDVINSSKAIGLNKLVNNNDVVLQLIYGQLNYQKDILRGKLNILNDALQASKGNTKEDAEKLIKVINNKLSKIDNLKQSIKNQLPNNEYLADPYNNTMEMLKSMEINDIPQFFNENHKVWKEGDGDRYYRIVRKKENGDIVGIDYQKSWDEGTKKFKKNVDIIVDAEGNEISRSLSKGDVWRPVEFRQRYQIISNDEIVKEGISNTSFALDSDAKWVREQLDRYENVKNIGMDGDEFFNVKLVYDDSIPVIFKNDVTGETFEGTIRKESAVDQAHGTEFKRVILNTEGNNPFEYLGEGRDEIALSYNSEMNKWKHSNEVGQHQYIIDEEGKVKFDYDKDDYAKERKSNVSLGVDEYEEAAEAGYKTRMSELTETIPEARYKDVEGLGDRYSYTKRAIEKKYNEILDKGLANSHEEAMAKAEINWAETKQLEAKEANNIADTTNTYSDIEKNTEAQSRILAFTNYDKIGEDTYLKYVRGRRNILLNNKKKELERIQSEWNKATMAMSKEEQANAIEDIKKTLWQWKANNKGKFTAWNPMGTNTNVKYKQIINEFANVFADEGWYNTNILGQINSVNSIDDIIVKLHTNDLISTMGINSNATSVNKARDIIYDWIRGSVKTDKEAMQIAKDFIGDPLGTGAAYKLMANTRAAYRFAKYGLLSPVSGAIMYANSAVLGNILLQGKKKGLEGYLGSSVFDEITGLDNVLSFLNRGDDLITNSGSDIENKGLVVNKMLNAITNTITKEGSKAREVLSTIMNGGYHSLYDLWHQGEVRKYAFAQALKQNHVYESQLPALLDLLKSGNIMKSNDTAVLWSNIMAKTEENYARFFSNASTSSLSRHRWSRLWGFNFLQGYVVNRTDEMMLGMRKWRDFVNQAGGFKNITWSDITRHLAEDNTELKSFMNNIILSAKMAYYLDKAADADGTEADNIKGYFIDTNDYLSSLDTVWFMRLLKAPLEGIGAYQKYSERAGDEATMWGGLKVGVYESFAEICKQFFREGKFLTAVLNPTIAAMQTGDIDFASTVAGVEWEKMANSLGRFGLVDGMEKYGLEDFSEDSDVIGQILLSTDRSTRVGKETADLYDISRVDSIINDEGYAAVTTIGYLPLIGELIKSATGNGGFSFSEAKYKKLMNMVDNDEDLKKLYKGELDVSLYSDEAINRLWTDFTSFNYPYKSMKSAGKHDVGSMFNGKDSTLNSMREDVFVQNICEKMNISIEDFHKMITENGTANAKTTGKLKVIAAAEAAEPGSGKIVLGYMMSNALYELEKEVSGFDYPSNADFTDEQMNYMKKVILNKYGNEMFTADKASWYKAVRELVSIKEPDIFNTLYKNETLNSYVGSIGFLDMLMWDAANKGDINARYIKNVFSVISKYMINPEARMKAIEHEFGVISELNTSQSVKNMAMEGVLAGNIDYYNQIKNNPTLSVLYKDVLDSFEHRVWGVMDNVDIQNDSMKRQGKKWYTPYTSQYGNDNKKVDDDLKNKAQKYYNPLTGGNKGLSYYQPRSTNSVLPKSEALNWYRKYYEGLIKDYTDKLVKTEGKKYPAQTIEGMTFKTTANNRGSIKGAKLTFPKHKSKEYRTNVLSNLPGSHG